MRGLTNNCLLGTYPAVHGQQVEGWGVPERFWRRMHRGDDRQLSALSMRKETNAICETDRFKFWLFHSVLPGVLAAG